MGIKIGKEEVKVSLFADGRQYAKANPLIPPGNSYPTADKPL